MGVFDTVIVSCPKCGEKHGFQSKGGDCILRNYELNNCPDDVLSNVNRHAPCKCDCGALFDVDIFKKEARLINS